MKSRSISIQNNFSESADHAPGMIRGFTLMEVIVVMGLMSLMLAIGLIYSFDSYRNYLFRSEYTNVINMIEKARNRAVNNFNESPHTFAILPTEYRIYADNTYDSGDPSTYESYARNTSLSLSTNPSTVVSFTFDQLSGDVSTCSSDCTIQFQNGLIIKKITINAQGGIITN